MFQNRATIEEQCFSLSMDFIVNIVKRFRKSESGMMGKCTALPSRQRLFPKININGSPNLLLQIFGTSENHDRLSHRSDFSSGVIFVSRL